jgi:hypothetical protein
VTFWHDGVPAAEHPELTQGDCWKTLDWSTNRAAKVAPIKDELEKSKDLNIATICIEAMQTFCKLLMLSPKLNFFTQNFQKTF